MSTPPVSLVEITSTADEPVARRAGRTDGRTVGYAQVVANITGNPAMSLPLSLSTRRAPHRGVHILGRFGDEATLVRPAVCGAAGAVG